MPVITVKKDPAGIKPVDIHNVNGLVILRDFLLEHFEPDFGGLHALIWINGRKYINTAAMSAERCEALLDVELGFFDNVRIELRPAGVELLIVAGVAIGAAALTLALAPRPRLPQLPGDEARTSSNQLNASRNGFRNRQAIADIGGECIVYPDFIQPSYYEYVANRRQFREIFCVGIGRHDVDLVKDGPDLIDNIASSSYTVYQPGVVPPDLKNVRITPNSQDVDLPAPDSSSVEVQIFGASFVLGDRLTMPDGSIQVISPEIGDILQLELTYTFGGQDFILSSTAEVTDVFTNAVALDITLPNADLRSVSGLVRNTTRTLMSPWFTLEGDEITEAWAHVKMPGGIRKPDGSDGSVSFRFEVEELDSNGDPTSNVSMTVGTFVGNTLSAQFATVKIDNLTPGRYRARVFRTTDSLGDDASDLLQLEAIASVTPYVVGDISIVDGIVTIVPFSGSAFEAVTLLEVRRATSSTTDRAGSDRISCRAQRLLQLYNSGSGTVGGTHTATRRFADYVVYLLHTVSGVPLSNIALDELFGIQGSIPEELGRFDGVFDDKNMSLRDRLRIVCNAARVSYWNEGLNWHFVRDEAKPFKALSFGRRNLKGGQQRYVQKFRRPADYDSVSIQWVDPVKNIERTVDRRILSDGSIATGLGARPLTFDMRIGVRAEAQAVNRAELEIRRLIYQGIEVQDTALNDALLTQIGQRVDYADIYDADIFDGEVLSVSGNVYTTSERFEPAGGVEYWVYVTDANGTPSNSVRAYPRADGNIFGFEADGLTGTYLADGIVQSGSRYVIASESDFEVSQFTVIARGRPNELGECRITLAEYNPLMYSED